MGLCAFTNYDKGEMVVVVILPLFLLTPHNALNYSCLRFGPEGELKCVLTCFI